MITRPALIALSSLVLLLGGVTSHAEPAFARLYKSQYGYQPSCNACHKDGGGSPINSYGDQFRQAKMNVAAFKAITDLDADGDGISNGDEIKAKANPADPESTPKNKGSWLSTANLIPKPVQAVFPGVTQYKPLDAIFTDKEIKRAAKLGVSLSKADENTIYVPVKDRKAAGTAIIVPGLYKGQSFYLLVATDRKLTVSHVQMVNAGELEGLDDETLYQGYAGTSVVKLTTGKGESLKAAIDNTVKKAGTILLVRLKKS